MKQLAAFLIAAPLTAGTVVLFAQNPSQPGSTTREGREF
jgi:hypothetical protein